MSSDINRVRRLSGQRDGADPRAATYHVAPGGRTDFSNDEEDDEDGNDQGAFVNRGKHSSRKPPSILPHQNFLAPRRPGPVAADYRRDGQPQRPNSALSLGARAPSPASGHLYRRSEDAERRLAGPLPAEQHEHHAYPTRRSSDGGILESRGDPRPQLGTQRSSLDTGFSHMTSNAGGGTHQDWRAVDQRSSMRQASSMSHAMSKSSKEPLLSISRPNAADSAEKSHDSTAGPRDRGPLAQSSEPHNMGAGQATTSPSTSSAGAPTTSQYLWSRLRHPAGNPWAFLGSLAVLLILGGLWMGFEARFMWYHVSPAVPIVVGYVWLASIVHMLVTAYQDPGTVPKELDPDPPTNSPSPGARDGGDGDGYPRDPEDPLYSPLPRIIRVRNGQDITLKWCETCHVYRPPRSSHCRVCDICVDGIDHHCTFLNTCIGRRNYTSFFSFLIFALITCVLCVVFSAVHLKILTLPFSSPRRGSGLAFQDALADSPMSAVLFILILFVFVPILTLFTYHLRLIMMGRTTVEQIRINTKKAHSYEAKRPLAERITWWFQWHLGMPGVDPNPFAYRDPCRNCCGVLCRPGVATTVLEKSREGRG